MKNNLIIYRWKRLMMLNFLNQVEIYNILTGIELSTFNMIRKILIDEFENIKFR